jgi:hypothetical protein
VNKSQAQSDPLIVLWMSDSTIIFDFSVPTANKMEGVLGIVHDLTKDSNIPPDVLERHVQKLQESVGLLSGNIQDVSKKTVQVCRQK